MSNGTLELVDNSWRIKCKPEVAIYVKRNFPGHQVKDGAFVISDGAVACRDLEWLTGRFPLDMDEETEEYLTSNAYEHEEVQKTLDDIVAGKSEPRTFELARPLRDYQAIAAEVMLRRKRMILGDSLGLGKSASSLGCLTAPETRPAIVVTYTHLKQQWKEEAHATLGDVDVYVLKKAKDVHHMPKHDIVIVSWHMLKDVWEWLLTYKTVIFDECQELRRTESQKYKAAKQISNYCEYSFGLSATPSYNMGSEVHHVMDVIDPYALGTWAEFVSEWCSGIRLKNPYDFGEYLKSQHIMLRRTREEVGREIPAMSVITHEVESDPAALEKIQGSASELARLILSSEKRERGQAMHDAAEFTNQLRQATGIAKAPYVARFVQVLAEQGEKIVLFGYHRPVYDIWLDLLADYKPRMYTGSENPGRKQAAKEAFCKGDSRILIVSLRSGAGLDGLQYACQTSVFGELDWSPQVIEQCMGRVARDGQNARSMHYLLVADGADPYMQQVLGIKKGQSDGILLKKRKGPKLLQNQEKQIKAMASDYLAKTKGKVRHRRVNGSLK